MTDQRIDLPELGVGLKVPEDAIWLELYRLETSETWARIKTWKLREGVTRSLPDGGELLLESQGLDLTPPLETSLDSACKLSLPESFPSSFTVFSSRSRLCSQNCDAL